MTPVLLPISKYAFVAHPVSKETIPKHVPNVVDKIRLSRPYVCCPSEPRPPKPPAAPPPMWDSAGFGAKWVGLMENPTQYALYIGAAHGGGGEAQVAAQALDPTGALAKSVAMGRFRVSLPAATTAAASSRP